MAFPWNPRAVLDIYPDGPGFTCVGTTKKGLRCKQSMISGADRSEASQILNTITLFHPTSRTVRENLEDLAYLTLCPRWHRKPGYCQVAGMVQKWQSMIEAHCRSTAATRPTTTPRRRLEVSTRSGTSTPPSPSQGVRTRRASAQSPETVVEEPVTPSTPRRSNILPPQPTISSTSPASAQRSQPSAPATPRRTTTSDSSSGLPTPPATPARQNNASAADLSPRDTSSPRSPRRNGANATTPLLPSTPVASAPAQTPCPRPHSVRRKPITDCCICCEEIHCSEDAVWCRAQCGQNVHRECFRDWRTHSVNKARQRWMDCGEGEENWHEAVNCVFCRTKWKWEWED